MTTYLEGLRISIPAGVISEAPGEQLVQFLARYLQQCTIGSATSSENNSGPNAPTADNIGQIRTDLGVLTNRVTDLESAQNDVTALAERVTELEKQTVYGTVARPTSGNTFVVTLPSSGDWTVAVSSRIGAFDALYSELANDQLTLKWTGSIPAGGAIDVIAVKKS